jgi:hypothetical protein
MNSNFDASCTKMILLYFTSSIFHLCLSCCVMESVGQKIHLLSKWTQSKSIFHNCTQRYWKYICGWLPSNNLKKFRWETFAKPPSSTFNSNLPWETPWWHPAFRSSCGVAAIVMLGDGSRCWRPGVPWLFGKPWGKHHIETLQMGLSENKVYP